MNESNAKPAAKELVLKSYFGTPHTDADDMTFSIVCQVPAVSFLRRLLHALCGRLVDCRRKALLAVLSQLARDGRCCWQAAARLPLTSLALRPGPVAACQRASHHAPNRSPGVFGFSERWFAHIIPARHAPGRGSMVGS